MTVGWQVKIPRSVEWEMDALPSNVRQEAVEVIAELKDDPFPSGSIPLRGHVGLYRVRFYRDAYRIVYQVSRKQRRVIITGVRPRKSAYAGP